MSHQYCEQSVLYLNKPKKVYLYIDVVDFRKQMNGLCHIIESEFPERSLDSSWFVFISRNKKQVKLIYWRGSGLAMWQYRLESEKFTLPNPRPTNSYGISWRNLERFLNGLNIFEGEVHERIRAKRMS